MASKPPPLKKGRKPPALKLDFNEPSIEERSQDPSEGEWLFKENGVVLGPVSAAVLMQRIDDGQTASDMPIGRKAGEWVPLHEVEYFYQAQKRAEARALRIQVQAEHAAAVKKRKLTRVAAFCALALVPLLAGTVLGNTLFKKRPWDDSAEWAKKEFTLVEVKPKPKPKPVEVKTPEPRVAMADIESATGVEAAAEQKQEASAEADKSTKTTSAKKTSTKKATRRSSKKKSSKKESAKTTKKEEPKKIAKADVASASPKANLPRKLTRKQIMTGFGKQKRRIGACLKAEIKRNPDMPSRVRVDFTITESGKAKGVKLLERQVRNGPLATCMKKALARVTWPRYSGARQNVTIPLTVRKN